MQRTYPILCLLLASQVAFSQSPGDKVKYLDLQERAAVPNMARSRINLSSTACTRCHMNLQTNIAGQNAGSGRNSYSAWVHKALTGLPMPGGLAATLTEPDDTTRKLLKLPADSGLVVTEVCSKFESGRRGVEENDIILTINGTPATSEPVVTEELQKDEVVIKVLRKGKEIELKPEPEKKATKKRYLLGIRLGELEPVVRAQLGLDEHVTVVIQGVNEGSAAEQAGIQEGDVLVKINGEIATGSEMVQKAVQSSAGEAVTLTLIRGGEDVEVSVTPELVETPVANSSPAVPLTTHDFADHWRMLYQPPAGNAAAPYYYWYYGPEKTSNDTQLQQKLTEIEAKIQELKALIESTRTLRQQSEKADRNE